MAHSRISQSTIKTINRIPKKMTKSIITELARVQKALKAPKDKINTFGNYKYRSCESILEAVKAVIGEECLLYVSDDLVSMGGAVTIRDEKAQTSIIAERLYVKATAVFRFGTDSITVHSYAREQVEKKGMDSAQITGSASSYARKYALCGLLSIDDNQDPDMQPTATPAQDPARPNPFVPKARPAQAPPQVAPVSSPAPAPARQSPALSDDDLIMKTWLNENGFKWVDLAAAINKMYDGKKTSWNALTAKQKSAFVASDKLEILETKITEAIRPGKGQ